MTEDIVQGLYDELYRLEDEIASLDPTSPHAESIEAHLQDLFFCAKDELILLGEEV